MRLDVSTRTVSLATRRRSSLAISLDRRRWTPRYRAAQTRHHAPPARWRTAPKAPAGGLASGRGDDVRSSTVLRSDRNSTSGPRGKLVSVRPQTGIKYSRQQAQVRPGGRGLGLRSLRSATSVGATRSPSWSACPCCRRPGAFGSPWPDSPACPIGDSLCPLRRQARTPVLDSHRDEESAPRRHGDRRQPTGGTDSRGREADCRVGGRTDSSQYRGRACRHAARTH